MRWRARLKASVQYRDPFGVKRKRGQHLELDRQFPDSLRSSGLRSLALRHVHELEASACVDPDKLGEAIELLNMARLAARRRPRRKPGEILPEQASRPRGQLIVGGVDLHRAPRVAVEDFLANREPPPKPVGPR